MGGSVADNFDWSIVIDLATKGGAKTVQEVTAVDEAVKRLGQSNEISEKQEDSARQATAKRTVELEKATQVTDQNTGSINAQRYALYEVAGAYTAVSAGLTALGASVASTFAEVESGFSAVERTSGLYGSAFAPLEEDLLQLSRTLPAVTSEIQSLSARGAQMGIAADNVADFADTLSRFIATSPEVDVNSVAEAFGRLSNLTGVDDFEAMASAIAQVGVNSAATDAQIIKTTEGMARASAAFGFTADEIIGLSAAFASLGVAPEAARGIMNQFVNSMEKGAAGVTDSMKAVAAQMGVTEEAATRLWKTDPTQFTQNLVKALAGADNLVVALSEMGLTGQRIVPLFAALTKDFSDNAEGASVLANALRDANQGFRERAELDRQFAPIADDLNSRLTIMGNAFRELAYTVGLEVAPVMKAFVDGLAATVQGITDFVSSPIGGFLTRMVAGLGAILAAYSALRGAIALSSAAVIAFRTAMGAAVGSGIMGALGNLVSLFRGTARGAHAAAGSTFSFAAALRAVGRATVIVAVFQALAEWMFNTASAAQSAGRVLIGLGNILDNIAQRIGRVFSLLGGLIPAVNSLGQALGFGGFKQWGESLVSWGEGLEKANASANDFSGAAGGMADILGDVSEGGYDAGEALGGGGGSGSTADGANKATEAIRTLLDYASDLSSVMSRAFEIRFGSETAADNITKTFNDLRKAAEEAAQKIRDIRSEIRALQADLGILQSDLKTQEYFLSIAVEYGDTARAEAIQANIAKLQSDIAKNQEDQAKKQAELTREQDANSKSLKGNSDQAIKNRDTIRGLVEAYQSQIEALAESGLSAEELSEKTDKLRDDFIKQATQLGFNRDELKRYEKGFDDASFAIANVPRNVTIDINANPALTALRELQAKAEDTMDAISGIGGGGIGGGGGGGGLGDLGGFDFEDLDMPDLQESFDSGKDTGDSWWSGFWDGVVSLNDKIGNWIKGLPGFLGPGFAKVGEDIGKFFSDTAPTWLGDTETKIKDWIADLPGSVGELMGRAFKGIYKYATDELAPALGRALSTFGSWIRDLPERLSTFLRDSGRRAWNFLTDALPTSLGNAFRAFRDWLSDLPGRLRTLARDKGKIVGDYLTDFGRSFAGALSRIQSWFRNLPANIWATVRNAASNIWNEFSSGFARGASSSSSRSSNPNVYANGGFTGVGAKHDPAGVVHRGEYVIPKKYVNQSTGLPYADALGKLVKGSPSPRGYANGGHVTANPGFGVVDLSAQSLQQLARLVSTQISVDGKIIGEAASRSYAAGSRAGAN